MVNCESKERVQIVPAADCNVQVGACASADFSAQFNAVYRIIRDIKPVEYGMRCKLENDTQLDAELGAIARLFCIAKYSTLSRYTKARGDLETEYSVTRPDFASFAKGAGAGFAGFRKVLRRLEQIGYVRDYGELKVRDDSPAIEQVTWKYAAEGKTFIGGHRWFERYVADMAKAVLDSVAPGEYELVSGAEVRFHKTALAEFDVMAAVGGEVFAIEVKTSAYADAAHAADNFDRFAERVNMFDFSPKTACLVCLDKTDDELEKLREVAAGRFAVHDNRTFSGWFAGAIGKT